MLRSVLSLLAVVAATACNRVGEDELPFSSAVIQSASGQTILAGVAFDMEFHGEFRMEAQGWHQGRRVRLEISLSQVEVILNSGYSFWRTAIGRRLAVGDDRADPADNLRVGVVLDNFSSPAPRFHWLVLESAEGVVVRGHLDGDAGIDFEFLLVRPSNIVDQNVASYLLPTFYADYPGLVTAVAKPVPPDWAVEVLP